MGGYRGRGFSSAAQPRGEGAWGGRAVCPWRLAGVSPAGLLQSNKEGWTDRWQRKPQKADIKGGAAQKQAGKELVSVTGWQAELSSALAGPGQARLCHSAPLLPPQGGRVDAKQPFSCPDVGQKLTRKIPDFSSHRSCQPLGGGVRDQAHQLFDNIVKT